MMLKTQKALGILGVLALAASLSATARAQESYESVAYNTSELSTRVGELEAELTALRERLDDGVEGGYEGGNGSGCCDSCCGSCCGCCDRCGRSQGFVAGADFVWLKPHNSSGTGPTKLYNAPGGELDPDFEPTLRYWVGYQRCDGLGVRARYWEFDHGELATLSAAELLASGVNAGSVNSHGWDTWVFDVEGTDSSKLGYWDVMLSGGFRHVEYHEAIGRVDPTNIAFTRVALKNFTGIGATSGAEFHRQVSCTLGAYASVRVSVLYGDEKNVFVRGVNVDIGNDRNDVKYMYEAQAGAEYLAPICGGGWYFARAGFEVQYWDTFGIDQNVSLNGSGFEDSSFGLAGFFFSAGMMR